MLPIFIITGPPAAGKSTLAHALMQRFERGLHIPVDDLREWVVSGLAGPLDWSNETTLQFELAEQSAADLACRYNDAGFAVAIDHCCCPEAVQELTGRFGGRNLVKLALLPSLATNHRRNRERTNKNFEGEVLTATIDHLHALYRDSNLGEQGWLVLENEEPLERVIDGLVAQPLPG
jgi:hypothetical protein